MTHRSGGIDLPTLEQLVADGTIDTVVVAFADLQGRLLGKRVVGRFFLDHVVGQQVAPASDEQGAVEARSGEGIEACDYLLTVDVDMNVLEGFQYASWEGGYGDFRAIPDLATLCVTPWLEATALVLCDVVDVTTGNPVEVSPRQILRRQLARAADLGLTVMCGSELEFFAHNATYDELAAAGYATMADTATSWFSLDYHVLQTTKDEPLLRAIRNGMLGAGLPVEFSKGEAAPGQHELNLRYSDALRMADNHAIYKNGAKEIADSLGKAITFMAKPRIDQPGSSCHIHTSIWSADGDQPLSPSSVDPHAMSDMMRAWLGGILDRSVELSLCFAPYVNSYRRYQPGSWAPTAVVWSPDNRTCGLRLVGHGAGLRVESRIPGADCNPYIAFAALIAAGLDGIERGLDCGEPFVGNAYTADDLPRIPWNLPDAIAAFRDSEFAAEALGPDVAFHLLHAADEEWRAFNGVVTEWEIRRNFERI
ncbi:MAG: glutamine synthetase family protein [Acidimicrobiales bacterium]